jgi:deoxyribonuclease IV
MLVIATPGAPLSTPKPGGTLKGLVHAHSLGIRGMEMEWVQSVPKNPEHVMEVGELAKKLGITLTVHAPFFINLNSEKPETIDASIKRILASLTMAQIAGAVSVCVHAAFYGIKDPSIALDNVRKATDKILKLKNKFFPDVNLAYETMGRPSQFGTLEELLAVSKEFDIYPCIDAAHMHARAQGKINSTKEWDELFDRYSEVIGKKSLNTMHLHFTGIEYGAKGEKHHLALEESDAKWKDYLKVLKKRKIGGVLVCESPLMEKDTLLLQKAYEKI